MSIFSLKDSKAQGTIPENCQAVIKKYQADGMFDVDAVVNGKQEYTTIYFLMTQDCNLNCAYCYQPKEFRQKDSNISKQVIDDTIDFAMRTFDEQKIKFSIFGGEPFINFEMIKYLVDTYPMFRYVVTTNGLILSKNAEVREWVRQHKHNLKLSVSISSLKSIYGSDYLEKVSDVLDLVKSNGGDVHYVVEDPTAEGVYEEIVYLFDRVPVVRISSARHWDVLQAKNDDYIKLFNKLADFIYFTGEPKFGRCQWDIAFHNNIYSHLKGKELKKVPPTFCGCGYLYLAVNNKGELYPCDLFANFPEFKMGDIYTGFNENSVFFKKMGDWLDDLYGDCKNCTVCEAGDIRLCPRAMCLGENYIVTGNPLKPAANHCAANRIEYQNFMYIAKKAIALGLDEVYNKGQKNGKA
jgi:uncharacterized protein